MASVTVSRSSTGVHRLLVALTVTALTVGLLGVAARSASPVLANGATGHPDWTTITASGTTFTADVGSTTITVQVKNEHGNVTTGGDTVELAVSTGGVGTVGSVTDNLDGTYTATFSSTESGSATITGTLNGADITDDETVTVTAGDPAQLAFTTDVASSYTADDEFTVEVEIQDQYGNLTDSTATVDLDLPGPVDLDGDTSVAAVGGAAEFPDLAVRTVGTYTIDASSGSLAGATSGEFDITPGALASFVIDEIGDQVAGEPFAVTATAYDAYDNVKTNYADTAALSGLDPSPACSGCDQVDDEKPATYGTYSTSNGLITFTGVVAYLAAPSTLTITDGSIADSADFTVDPADLADFVIDDPIGDRIAGTAFNVTATAYDAYGNVKTDYAGTAALGGLANSPVCPCDQADDDKAPTYGSYTTSNGLITFTGVVAYLAESAADVHIQDGDAADDSDTFAVAPGAVLADFVIGSIGSQVAGFGFEVTATAYDAYGNVKTNYDGTPTLSGLGNSPTCSGCDQVENDKAASYGTYTNNNDGTVTFAGVIAYLAESAADVHIQDGDAADDSDTFAVAPGALGDFVLSAPDTTNKVAGTAFTVTATVYDAFGNLKTNYSGGATVTGTLGTSPGVGATAPAGPSYGTFPGGNWTTGTKSASVTAYKAEGGRTITVSDGAATVTSGTFTVDPAPAAHVHFSDNSGGENFNAQPIDTKVGTPIYHQCVPASSGTNPCALVGDVPGSAPVEVLVRDAFGNRVLATDVTIRRDSAAGAVLGNATTVDGVASFGDGLVIGVTSANTDLHARANAGTNPTVESNRIRIVTELAACDGTTCTNTAEGSAGNSQTRAYGRIDTDDDFFGNGNNVLLSTTFAAGSEVNQQCGSNQTLGQAVEQRYAGAGIGTTTPQMLMVVVLPKNTLKAAGVTSRNAAAFDVCLGLIRQDGTDAKWKAKDRRGRIVDSTGPITDPIDSSIKRYWGVPANCGTAGLRASDPCVSLKTKSFAELQAKLGLSTQELATFFTESDVAVVIEKPFPWDGKAGIYRG